VETMLLLLEAWQTESDSLRTTELPVCKTLVKRGERLTSLKRSLIRSAFPDGRIIDDNAFGKLEADMKQPDDLSYATALEVLHSKFRIRLGETPITELELVATQEHGGLPQSGSPGAAETESFSLYFLGPINPVLPQGTYIFQQERLGEFSLFIVPIGRETNGIKYEAVINRLRRGAEVKTSDQ
jgi:hypothetical protein